MNRDHKIEKINAYRKLLETRKLPKLDPAEDASTNSLVAKELNSEFQSWVEGQISVLLGETLSNPTGSLPFSEDEIDILKTLIAGVKARRSAPAAEEIKSRPQIRTAPSTLSKAQDNPLSDAERSRLNATAKPLGNRRMAEASKTNNNDALVSSLERMEDEGPKY